MIASGKGVEWALTRPEADLTPADRHVRNQILDALLTMQTVTPRMEKICRSWRRWRIAWPLMVGVWVAEGLLYCLRQDFVGIVVAIAFIGWVAFLMEKARQAQARAEEFLATLPHLRP